MITNNSLKLGDRLPDFKLKSIENKIYTKDDYKGKKILVIVFTCNHCPYAQAYEDRLIELQKSYLDKSVQFIAINSNDDKNYPEDSFENMIKRSKMKKFNYPYLRDDTQNIAKLFGTSYTPEIFVFDENRILKYHGRIDDNWQEADKVKSHDLKNALECMLNNKSIKRTNTQAIGCSIKWK